MKIEQITAKLRSFYFKNRRLPSYREMCEIFGFTSKNSIFRIVKKLTAQDIVEKDSLGKLKPKRLLSFINVLGNIQAGTPTPAEEQLLQTVSRPESIQAPAVPAVAVGRNDLFTPF